MNDQLILSATNGDIDKVLALLQKASILIQRIRMEEPLS